MAETAGPPPLVEEEAPSLDPRTIEHAYRRERRRRNSKLARRDDVRSSNARFFFALSLLLLLTVLIALSALSLIQHTFGI